MSFFYIKALHIIFVVTWFSGMFYLCRLFIYQREANDKPIEERKILLGQFSIMTRRLLYGITWPSAILTLIFGSLLLFFYPAFPGWLWLKFFFVISLYFYHFSLQILYKQHLKGEFKYTSQQLRWWNELPTILLVAIVMLVVVREKMSVLYSLIGLFGLIVAIFSAINIYKHFRQKQKL
jgi:putative membrane protein